MLGGGSRQRRQFRRPRVTGGVLDELQIHQIPVLFGGGHRLFEVLPSRAELELVRVIDTPEAIHIR
jgi:dihydrofolate reductase